MELFISSFKCYHCKKVAQKGITKHCIYCGYDVHISCKSCPTKKGMYGGR